MSQAQFGAILEMSEHNGLKSQFEAVEKNNVIDKTMMILNRSFY